MLYIILSIYTSVHISDRCRLIKLNIARKLTIHRSEFRRYFEFAGNFDVYIFKISTF